MNMLIHMFATAVSTPKMRVIQIVSVVDVIPINLVQQRARRLFSPENLVTGIFQRLEYSMFGSVNTYSHEMSCHDSHHMTALFIVKMKVLWRGFLKNSSKFILHIF